jgi:uncharacterized repeat protein (TIGR02543 family)
VKIKAVLLLLIAGFLAISACTNPILERAYNIDKETPEPEIIPDPPPEIPPVTYTVAFESNGGSSIDSQTVTEGEKASRPEDPTQDGYGFVNWYDNEELTGSPYDFETPVIEDFTLYAKWIPAFAVAFMDGSTVLSALAKSIAHGSTVSRPDDPPKDDYIFYNWYKDSDLTMLFDFDTPITEHTSVYAGWSGEEFAGALINKIFDVADTSEWDEAVSDIIDIGNDKNYVINVTDDFSIMGSTTATFGNVSGVAVSLRGASYQGYARTLTLNGTGSIVCTANDQNIILRGPTLRGHGANNASLVYVNGGTFTMYGGEVSGNTNSSYGGGVHVASGGTLTMYGGEISGNTSTANYGGGVYVPAGGTLLIVTGIIYGSGEDENVKNIGGTSASLWRSTSATTQYGTFSGGIWSSNGTLSSVISETIRVVNGVRQPNFNSVNANGFPLLTTTALTLTFNQAIPGLSAADIVLSGVPGVAKGQLSGPSGSGSGPFTYKLPISGFTQEGTLSVSVSKTGYSFGRPRTVTIYYSSHYVFIIDRVTIHGKTFTMGSPTTESNRRSDETQHEVTVSGFRMSKYQITQELYEAVMGTNPSFFSSGSGGAGRVDGLNTANFPVEQVSWYDALVFCNKLSVDFSLTPAYSINGSTDPEDWGTVPTNNNATWNVVHIVEGSTGYRLPTEAQWEYACRAGTTTAYNWGTDAVDLGKANYGSTPNRTTEVGSYDHNNWSLYDMHGNVWEWCWDWYDTYPSEAQTDPTGPDYGTYRVMRGGGMGINGEYLRSAMRDRDEPIKRSSGIGFRVVLPGE